jgi:K+-sensing histidine kinase KdpD
MILAMKKGRACMSTIEHVLPFEAPKSFPWQRYLLDSGLACGGAMLVTGIIYLFQLYPRIPNISIIYLLVVLALASTRGRYPAVVASLVASLRLLVPRCTSLLSTVWKSGLRSLSSWSLPS